MRNRVGKQIVFVLLALLLVFGVATSALAADVNNAIFADGVLTLDVDGVVDAAALVKIIAPPVKNTTTYELISLPDETRLWSTIRGAKEVNLSDGAQYRIKRSTPSGFLQWDVTTHDFTVKIKPAADPTATVALGNLNGAKVSYNNTAWTSGEKTVVLPAGQTVEVTLAVTSVGSNSYVTAIKVMDGANVVAESTTGSVTFAPEADKSYVVNVETGIPAINAPANLYVGPWAGVTQEKVMQHVTTTPAGLNLTVTAKDSGLIDFTTFEDGYKKAENADSMTVNFTYLGDWNKPTVSAIDTVSTVVWFNGATELKLAQTKNQYAYGSDIDDVFADISIASVNGTYGPEDNKIKVPLKNDKQYLSIAPGTESNSYIVTYDDPADLFPAATQTVYATIEGKPTATVTINAGEGLTVTLGGVAVANGTYTVDANVANPLVYTFAINDGIVNKRAVAGFEGNVQLNANAFTLNPEKDQAYTLNVSLTDLIPQVPAEMFIGNAVRVALMADADVNAAVLANVDEFANGVSNSELKLSTTAWTNTVKAGVAAAALAQKNFTEVTFTYESTDPTVSDLVATTKLYIAAQTKVNVNALTKTYAADVADQTIFADAIDSVTVSYGNTQKTILDKEAALDAFGGVLTIAKGEMTRLDDANVLVAYTVAYKNDNDIYPEDSATVNATVARATTTVTASTLGGAAVALDGAEWTGMDTTVFVDETVTVAITKPADNTYITGLTVSGSDNTVVADDDKDGKISFTAKEGVIYTVEVTAAEAAINVPNSINLGSYAEATLAASLAKVESVVPSSVAVSDLKVGTFLNGYQTLKFEDIVKGAQAFQTESVDVTYRYVYSATNPLVGNISKNVTVILKKDAVETQVNLKSGVTVDYSEDLTKEDILALVFENVTDVDGNVITTSTKDVKISGIVAAGQQKFVVTYAGNSEYVKSSNEVTVTINKATATVDVVSKIVRYGQQPTGMINVNPTQAAFISFYAGLNANDQATVIHVNLPRLVDAEGLDSLIPGVNLGEWLSKLEDQFEGSVSLSKLSSTLSSLMKELNKYDNLPVNVDTTSINMLVKVLEQVGKLEGIGDPVIELSIGDVELPTDAGAYLVGAVVSDMNYNTAADLGYLVIKPDGTRVDLAFNIEDENCIVTREAILNGSYDLGSHVEQGSLTDAQLAEASEKLVNVYAGVNLDGEFYVDNAPSAEIGAYTQLAYIRDFGNTMYYAVPIARAYVVVADTVNIYFIDENGNENDERLYTYDGNGKSMTAVAYTKAGEKLNSKDITYYYIGIEGDAEGYYAKNPSGSKLPTEAGVYTVIATYINENQSLFGVTAGAMVIQPAEAEIDVTNKLVNYTGKQVSVTDMIDKDPDDAAVTIIVASVNVAGDFSEDGFSALEGYVNFDLPARMDNVIKQIIPNAYENGVSVSTVKSKLKEALGMLGEADVAQIKELQELLSKIDNSVTLTFKETKNVATKDIGMYLVIGAITDPNYRFDADAGLLVIAPNVDTAELKWNYTDPNGIITLPKLDTIDMGATAYHKNGEPVNELTAKIDYIYIGVDEKGESVFVKNPASLSNGLYTEIAYIYEKEVSANMWVVKPIMRQVLIVTQTVNVKVTDKTVNYDGNRHAVDVSVKTKDGSAVDYNSLTVTYTGLNTDGAYHSTTAPKDVGIYSVVATYEVRNNHGDVKYFGMDAGLLTIKPVTSDVDVVYTEVAYDGTEKMATINAADGLNLIKVVVDSENNINIILPENVYSGTKTFDVSSALTSVEQELKNLDKDVLDTLIAVIQKINAQVGTLSINGKQPVEVGTYTVYAIAYAANTVPSYDFDRLVIIGAGQATATPTPVVTATPAPVDPDATPTPVVTATPAPVDPDATPTPVVTATPAPVDPDATPTPVVTATPAPVDPDATPTTAPTATTAPEAPATAAPSDAPTATPKPLPSTGDQNHNALWMLLMIFSGAALLLVCRKMTVKGR